MPSLPISPLFISATLLNEISIYYNLLTELWMSLAKSSVFKWCKLDKPKWTNYLSAKNYIPSWVTW